MIDDAPKIIWLLPHGDEQRCWCDHPDPSGMGHEDEADEYIRADLVEALEAENQRLRATLSAITATDCYSRDECTAMARAALRSTREGG